MNRDEWPTWWKSGIGGFQGKENIERGLGEKVWVEDVMGWVGEK
jgi:hypothetical protein